MSLITKTSLYVKEVFVNRPVSGVRMMRPVLPSGRPGRRHPRDIPPAPALTAFIETVTDQANRLYPNGRGEHA